METPSAGRASAGVAPSAGSATRITVSTFGAMAGLAGIEHGIGEILQGGAAPEGVMILSWPWALLAPLNPIRGLLAFSEFHYPVHTIVDGQVYVMANVPRLYVPIYILIRTPLLALFGAALAVAGVLWPRLAAGSTQQARRDIALTSLTRLIFFGKSPSRPNRIIFPPNPAAERSLSGLA